MSEVISGFLPNSEKATSCSSDAASNTFQYWWQLAFSIYAPSPSCIATWNGMKSRQCKTFHFSQWIVNWTNWHMYTRCLNKEWQTWEFGIPSNQQSQHICVFTVLSEYQQMFGFTLTAIDGMQNFFFIGFFMCGVCHSGNTSNSL